MRDALTRNRETTMFEFVVSRSSLVARKRTMLFPRVNSHQQLVFPREDKPKVEPVSLDYM